MSTLPCSTSRRTSGGSACSARCRAVEMASSTSSWAPLTLPPPLLLALAASAAGEAALAWRAALVWLAARAWKRTMWPVSSSSLCWTSA